MNEPTGPNQPTAGPAGAAAARNTGRKPGRPPKKAPGVRRLQVTAHLDAATVEALDAEAALLRLPSRSDVIRRACEEWLRRQEKKRNRTPGEDGDQ